MAGDDTALCLLPIVTLTVQASELFVLCCHKDNNALLQCVGIASHLNRIHKTYKLFTLEIFAYDDSHIDLEVAHIVKHCSKLTYNVAVTLVNYFIEMCRLLITHTRYLC